MSSTFNAPEQVPFGTDNFAENPEPRCPCLLLLDRSSSMAGAPIRELNAGLSAFSKELLTDSLAMKRVEIAVVSFGPVRIESEFYTAANFSPPTLTAGGDTPMGEAIQQAIAMVQQRKDVYKSSGILSYRPWIFMITDGAPTDTWQNAAQLVREGETQKSFAFFAVGVQGSRIDILKQIATREPLKLQGFKFREMFLWLSNSMRSVSQSTPGTTVPLAPPTGWAEV